jgi:hypothetical protein
LPSRVISPADDYLADFPSLPQLVALNGDGLIDFIFTVEGVGNGRDILAVINSSN